jgi:hypothetical protein
MKSKTLLYLSLAFICSCASVGAPTGGIKDITPPRLINSNPDSAEINFSGNTIRLTFDEFFTTNNLQSQLIFSPPLINKPTFKTKKQTLIIELKDTLKPNTTYTIHFGEGIKDLNEGNVLKNFSRVFSTGSYIDSFSLSGQIIDAQTNEPAEDVKVFLYKEINDSNVIINKPYYVTTTNEGGAYTFNHISLDSFYLFSLQDINNNYTFEKGEKVAFSDSLVVPDSTSHILYLAEHRQKDSLQLISSSINRQGKVSLLFNTHLENTKITIDYNFGTKNKRTKSYYFVQEDSLLVYLPEEAQNLDSILLSVRIDSSVFIQSFNQEKFTLEPLVFNQINALVHPNKSLEITPNNPIYKYNSEKLLLLLDSVGVAIKSLALTKHNNLEIETELKPGGKYQLIIRDSFASDLNGKYSSKDTLSFTTLSAEGRGSVDLSINCALCSDSFPLRVQISKGNTLISERPVLKSTKLYFNYMVPGQYSVRAYYDANNNKHWDSHDFLLHKQAEKWFFYSEKIDVRANWEIKNLSFLID